MDNHLKTCSACKQELSLSNFYKRNETKAGYKSHCKSCVKKQRNEYYKTPKGFKYSIEKAWADKGMTFTVEQYDALLKEQNNCCAICNKESNKNGSRLCVDHNHVTGAIRGLLCHDCNTTLGKMNDDISLLNKAIEYLRKYNADNN